MNVISLGNSSDHYWKELVFIESRLGADERTAHLKVLVNVQRMKSDEIWKAEREIAFLVEDSRALAKTADVRIAEYMDEVYSATSYEVKQKRKDSRYEKLIKVNLSKIKQLSFAAQKEEILRMKTVLELDLYTDSFRDAQNIVLDKALVEIDRILVMQKQVEKRQMFYRQDVEAWKKETNKVRTDVFGELMLLSEIPGESWARSFFPSQKRAQKLSGEELAKQEEARAEKREKKSKAAYEREQLRLQNAKKKTQYEKEKAKLNDQFNGGVNNQGGGEGENPAPVPVNLVPVPVDNPPVDNPVPVPVPAVPVPVESPVPEQV